MKEWWWESATIGEHQALNKFMKLDMLQNNKLNIDRSERILQI